MKKLILLFIAVAVVFTGCSNTKTTNEPAVNSILGDISYERLYGVMPDAKTNEMLRIKTHLSYVEGILREKDMTHLSAGLQKNRSLLLDYLHAYRTSGIFPVNAAFENRRVPCFIDNEKRICAVGYLVERTAGRAVAEEINRRHQFKNLLDMNDALVDNWIEHSGLSKLECAMIQPTYGWYPAPTPVNTTNNYISNEYGISSSLFSGVNISLNTLNAIQISKGSDNRTLPIIGVLMGACQIALGVNNIPETEINSSGGTATNESQKALSMINIGLGTSAVLLSTWNLIDRRNHWPKKVSWNILGFPADQNKLGVGFSYARTF